MQRQFDSVQSTHPSRHEGDRVQTSNTHRTQNIKYVTQYAWPSGILVNTKTHIYFFIFFKLTLAWESKIKTKRSQTFFLYLLLLNLSFFF